MLEDLKRQIKIDEVIGKVDLALTELRESILKRPTEHMGDGTTERPDIAEGFSVPRVTQIAKEMGAVGGFALDLTTTDDHGRRWDFDDDATQRRAMALVRKLRPRLIIGSPVCTPFSALQALNRDKYLDPAKKELEKKAAMKHLRFCIDLYREQMSRGDFFVHEHPACAT